MSNNNPSLRKQHIPDGEQLELNFPQLIMIAGSSEVRSLFKKKRMVSTGQYVRKDERTGRILYAVYNGRNPKDQRECYWKIMLSELAS